MKPVITRAMILAAGLGTRMRPLTNILPKPLVRVCGKTLIDHALDRLVEAGVSDVVVNSHYLADLLEAHLTQRDHPTLVISRETELLETGGGLVKALPLLGDAPIFVVNADSFWANGTHSTLARLAAAFDPARMDSLLLLHRTVTAIGYDGQGDYFADQLGRLRRRSGGAVAPYAYAGVHILNPKILQGYEVRRFGLGSVWDRLQDQERLYGQVHDGLWFHVGTPDDLTATEDYCRERRLFGEW